MFFLPPQLLLQHILQVDLDDNEQTATFPESHIEEKGTAWADQFYHLPGKQTAHGSEDEYQISVFKYTLMHCSKKSDCNYCTS